MNLTVPNTVKPWMFFILNMRVMYYTLIVLTFCGSIDFKVKPTFDHFNSISNLFTRVSSSIHRPTHPMVIRTLLIDNFDSYTFNIWQYLADINTIKPRVVYNNDYKFLQNLISNGFSDFDNIVISPGPGSVLNRDDFGICREVLLQSTIPVLGVCLGHQGLAHVYGGHVVRASTPIHGRLWRIKHSGKALFEGIEQDTSVIRYHSLIVDHPLPPCLELSAWTDDGVIMGLQHRYKHLYGVQFHPESIGTVSGKRILENFYRITCKRKLQVEQMASIIGTYRNYFTSRACKEQSSPLIHESTHLGNAAGVRSKQRHVYLSKPMLLAANNNRDPIEYVFTELFSQNNASFWLDSPGHFFVSSTTRGKSKNQSRFSIIGALDTPYSYAIEYYGGNRLIQRFSNGTELQLDDNIINYIKQEVQSQRDDYDVVVHSSGSKVANIGSSLNEIAKGRVLFGYLGYEARHETTCLLLRQTSDLDNIVAHRNQNNIFSTCKDIEFDKDMESLRVPITKNNACRLSALEGLFLVPSRYIVCDHRDSCLYIVGIRDELETESSICREDARTFEMDESFNDLQRKVELALLNFSLSQSNVTRCNDEVENNSSLPTLVSTLSREHYRRSIQQSLDYIERGETYELCLTLKFTGQIKSPTPTVSNFGTSSPLKSNSSAPLSRETPRSCNIKSNSGTTTSASIRSTTTSTAATAANKQYSPLSIHKRLRRHNSAPYSCFLQYGADPLNVMSDDDAENVRDFSKSGFAICCSSPERYLKLSKAGEIESKPIKGTARRNLQDATEDEQIALKLQFDEKCRAENLMIVDLVRNDLGRICEIGSVKVPSLMQVETYSTVHQLVSTITGKLSEKYDISDALVATFPGGSMTGAPKLRTCELIDELENHAPRGIYSGTIGWIGCDGSADLNIVIRTAVISAGNITVGAGGAIVAMSDADNEVDEVLLKARAVSSAIGCEIKFSDD